MNLTDLITRIKHWARTKFTGIVKIHFHEGGIRSVRMECNVKENT